MKRSTTWMLGVVGALLMLFGLACLNYTKPDDLPRHREFARAQNLPAPENAIVYIGVAAAVSGSVAIGFALGSGRSKKLLIV